MRNVVTFFLMGCFRFILQYWHVTLIN